MMTCAEFEAIASEFALGLLDGHDRAAALAHLDQCPTCRTLADELAQAADSLLVIAPPAEPPPGFETRVLARLDGAVATARRAWWRRPLLGVAAALFIAVAVFGVMRWRTGDGGDQVRASHRWAVGTMWTPEGEDVGVVYVADDPNGFVRVRVNRWDKPGVDYYVRLDYEDGESRRVELTRLESGAFNALLPERDVRLTEVSMVKEDGTVLCHGNVEY